MGVWAYGRVGVGVGVWGSSFNLGSLDYSEIPNEVKELGDEG